MEKISNNMFVAIIKTPYRMHNMMTLQEKTFEARYRKAIETEKYYMPFLKKCRQLYPRYENLFYVARTQIHLLIFEIKSFYGEFEKLREDKVRLKESIGQ